jgi:hypothetical protein
MSDHAWDYYEEQLDRYGDSHFSETAPALESEEESGGEDD